MLNASTNIERGINLAGRNLVMAKALFGIVSIAGLPQQMTRGDLGLTTSPAEQVDVMVAMDSLFTSVEKSNPSCVAEIQSYRFSQPWIDLVQAAGRLIEAQQADSAEKLVRRAQLLERETPYTWQLLASIAQQRDDIPKTLEYWERTYETAGGSDTNTVQLKFSALYVLGEINLGQSTIKQGAEGRAAATEAAKWYKRFLEEGPKHNDAPAARANLATAYMQAGDTAMVPTVYADLLANPNNYTPQDHFNSGVAANNAKFFDDALKLFGNTLSQSPYHRDALYNTSVILFQLKQYDRMLEPAKRLLEVDPNNESSAELVMFGYAMIGTLQTDSALLRSTGDSLKVYTDEYERLKANYQVTHGIFERGDTSTTLVGEVENKGTADRSFTLVYDFLDKSGAVIGQGQATVGPVKPSERMLFEVRLNRGGVIAYKGRRIPPM
jgi:tetratricopeptide (TPR) repeat protein